VLLALAKQEKWGKGEVQFLKGFLSNLGVSV